MILENSFLRVAAIASLLAPLFLVAGCGRGSAESEDLASRVATLETTMREQAAQHAEEKQLMVRALEASTNRLDALLRSVTEIPLTAQETANPNQGAPSPPPEASSENQAAEAAANPEGIAANPASAPPVSTWTSALEKLDLGRTAMIFLAVSLLLLVAFVVFFPGRLRSEVPRIAYSAEADRPVEEVAAIEAPEKVDPTQLAEVSPSGPRRFPDPEVVDGSPVSHELALRLADPKGLEDLVDLLDSYLNTEPYILRNPAPRVALVQGQLHLQFYALPNLSKAEHALLDATVRRLQPRRARETEDAPAA